MTKKKTYEKPQLIYLSEKKIALGYCDATGSGDTFCFTNGSNAEEYCGGHGNSAVYMCEASGNDVIYWYKMLLKNQFFTQN